MQGETMARTESGESQPLVEIVSRLSNDLQLLAREEAALAKREIGEKLSQAKPHAASLVLGVVVAAGGGLALVAAAVLALSLVLAAWLAALIVGVTLLGVGALLIGSGKAKLSRINLKPERTLESMRKDVAAIKRAIT